MASLERHDQDSDSASDEDYNPDKPAATEDHSEADSSDDEAAGTLKKRKQDDGLDWDNSGDETTIRKAKRKKRHSGAAPADLEEETGDGGFTKTRAQRRAENQEKQYTKPVQSTLDVDSIWAQMTASSKGSTTGETLQSNGATPGTAPKASENLSTSDKSISTTDPQKTVRTSHGTELVTIKRSYEFAGETITEERTVAADSAEAKLYNEQQATQAETAKNPPLRRPKKRPLLSTASGDGAQGSKLNTLEKSKLDWAGFVDQEGIGEELDGHDKAKDEYLGRMDFLGRLGAKKEDELRKLKQKQ